MRWCNLRPMHTREIEAYGGLVNIMPSYAVFLCFLRWLMLDYLELRGLWVNF